MNKIVLIVFLLLASIAIWWTVRKPTSPEPAHGPKKLRIVCTIGMITDTVKNIAGEHAIVDGLMGPGVDPHLYRARQSDVAKLADADIIFYNGLHLEGKMSDLFEKLGAQKTTVAVSDAIPRELLRAPSEFEGHYDPHIWFDAALWIRVTQYIASALCDADPDHCSSYRKRADAYTAQLRAVDAHTRNVIASIPAERRMLITAHDAFGYFGKAYNIKVHALQGLSTESEAGAKDVRALVDIVVHNQIPAIFVESSIPRRTIQAVQKACEARGWNVAIGDELFSDAMGHGGTPEGTYIGMIEHNVHAIVNGLKGTHG